MNFFGKIKKTKNWVAFGSDLIKESVGGKFCVLIYGIIMNWDN